MLINKKINYSIIIPHKNIPELLQRCLDSIPRREDIQIIVVDDNSDPDKVDFKNFPGLSDPFIEVVFTKEGKGAGYARNIGLTKAIGEWLLFADADDFYNYCINDILDEYVNSDADIIFFKHNSLDSASYTTTYRTTFQNTFIDYWFTLEVQKKADILLRYKHTSVCAKFFKKSFIDRNSILFDEVYISNDVTFAYLAGFYAHSIYADSRALYCATVRQGSIRRSRKNIEKQLDSFYVGAKRYRFFLEHGIPLSFEKGFVNTLTKKYFFDKRAFLKTRDILFNLGFTSGAIIRLCIYNVLIYIPKKIVKKMFPDGEFLPIFYFKFRKF